MEQVRTFEKYVKQYIRELFGALFLQYFKQINLAFLMLSI